MFYDKSNKRHRKIRETNLVQYIWRFKIIPCIMSPVLYPVMMVKRHNITGKMKSTMKSNQTINAWLIRNDFNETKQGFMKQAEIYNNNPLYYKEPTEVESIIYDEFWNSLISTGEISSIRKDVDLYTQVEINYATRAELLKLLEGDEPSNSEYSSTLISMAKMNNCTPNEMLEQISKDNQKLKFMVYTIIIKYKYYDYLRILATLSMTMVTLLLLLILVIFMSMQN